MGLAAGFAEPWHVGPWGSLTELRMSSLVLCCETGPLAFLCVAGVDGKIHAGREDSDSQGERKE